jgi:arylsulfatase A-like enzyme
LDQDKLLDNTTLVVFADQGENLYDGDLDLYSHNNIDSKHVLNVPFAIYQKDQPGKIVSDKNYSLNDMLNIILNPDKITDYARSDLYIEADLDVHNPKDPLYAGKIGEEILDTRDLNNIIIRDNDALQKYKKRAVLEGDYILTYQPIKDPQYGLYQLSTDPLFQSDQQKNQPALFSALQKKLDEFVQDTKRY